VDVKLCVKREGVKLGEYVVAVMDAVPVRDTEKVRVRCSEPELEGVGEEVVVLL